MQTQLLTAYRTGRTFCGGCIQLRSSNYVDSLKSRFIKIGAVCRFYDDYVNKLYMEPGKQPIKRTWETLTIDVRRARQRYLEANYDVYRRKGTISNVFRDMFHHEMLPYDCSFLIIGGGIVGSSIAYWLRQRFRDEEMKIVVLERDDTFSQCATVLSVGGIRQQFSEPENVKLSLFSAEFLRHAGEHLRILDSDPPDIQFSPMGYLFLARNETEAQRMQRDNKVQLDCGAKVKLLNRDELRLKFPFINFDDIALGSFGLENEGWFDPWSLLSAVREKNLALGVQYVKARVVDYLWHYHDGIDPRTMWPEDQWGLYRRMIGVIVKPEKTDASPRPIRCMMAVNAAGPWAGEVARLAGIGQSSGFMSIPMPVEPRKRYVYVVHVPDGPGLNMPFLIDPSGVWCRREGVGNTYLCGRSPTEEEDAKIDHSNLNVDENFFHEQVWPILAQRIPAFEKLKVKNSWAGYYDYCTFDQNAIIGVHPIYSNFFQCAGFSGHGIQHAMAVGRAVMEKFLDGAYININLRRFDMNRLIKNNPLKENGFII